LANVLHRTNRTPVKKKKKRNGLGHNNSSGQTREYLEIKVMIGDNRGHASSAIIAWNFDTVNVDFFDAFAHTQNLRHFPAVSRKERSSE
jgi:hypothetical protein